MLENRGFGTLLLDANKKGGSLVNRRDFLTTSGLLAAGGMAFGGRNGFTLAAMAKTGKSLPPKPSLSDGQVLFIDGRSAEADKFAAAFNSRTSRTPKLRALCKTPEAVAAMLKWAREHGIPFALRSGGHCFEDFSQSSELVIDIRLLNKVDFDSDDQMVSVGAGATLSDINKVLVPQGRTIPAGICQSVGIAGLTLGGGIGYLSRSAGLTCDVLESLKLFDAGGRLLNVSAQSHADLFWACRGGGGGSFGVATQFRFRTIAAPKVIVFEIDWVLTPGTAAHLMAAWQSWGPGAPDQISTILQLSRRDKNRLLVRVVGQSFGTEQQLNFWIREIVSRAKPWSPPRLRHHSFTEATNYFSEPAESARGYYKFYSDIVSRPLPLESLGVLFDTLINSPVALSITCEALGGAVSRVPVSATAFPHRNGASFKIQYSVRYRDRKKLTENLPALSRLYKALRPAMSGAAYVNYCDADLKDWPRAYWQSNLERLMEVKRKYDPENVFRHRQSVPLR